MGSVYRAQQTDPIRRDVALKVIRSNRDSKKVISRFEAERQALAMMDHPNIAKILDAGSTEDGSPFFAMELVDGEPFNRYCDRNQLSIRERLQLFLPICQAVQHAHQKGVIHRDLKPSNVLVGIYDGKPIPKVIDFGLAKATDQQTLFTDESIETEIGRFVGTLQFTSPEQAENLLDIDTRTDIYSLGVMLYELLSGSIPLDSKTVEQKGMLQVLQLICNTDPPRPSARLLNESADSASSISDRRQIEPRRLQRILRGDLDWIVMKAIDKDRTRRYESASGFAADIVRFLADEPVVARPPSVSYRLRKFIRKNRALTATAAIVFTTLIVAIFAISMALSHATKNAELAMESAKKATESEEQERLAKDKAELEAENAKTSAERSDGVLQIVTDAFSSTDPELGSSADMKAKDVLLNAKEILESSNLDDLGRIKLLSTLTPALLHLGEYGIAAETAQNELAIRKELDGIEAPETLQSMLLLASALRSDGRQQEALQLYEEAYHATSEVFGASAPKTLVCMNNLALAYQAVGRLEDSLTTLEQVVKKQQASIGPDAPDTLTSLTNLAVAYAYVGRLQDAIPLLEETLEKLKEVINTDHPETLSCMNALAHAYDKAGRPGDSISLSKTALELQTKKLGIDHPETLVTMSNMAAVYYSAKQFKTALTYFERALAGQKQKLVTIIPKP